MSPANTDGVERPGRTARPAETAQLFSHFAEEMVPQTKSAVDRAGGAKHDDSGAVHEAAKLGTQGAGGPLPHLAALQQSFGKHDVADVKAHTDHDASAGARAMGAEAFAHGDHVAFGEAPSLHLAAHEAAHVIQQRGGVALKSGVGQVGDPYEQHAEAVADLVVQGKSAEPLLDQYAGAGRKSANSGTVQRHVFVEGQHKTQAQVPAKLKSQASDHVVRDYLDENEMMAHAANSTDNIGNLNDGTWVRFEPQGTLNVLGERHTDVTLKEVVKAVGSTSFIYEEFPSDNLSEAPNLQAVNQEANAAAAEEMGIGKTDLQKHGAESLFPKLGVVFLKFLPYLSKPTTFSHLTEIKPGTKPGKIKGSEGEHYLGRLFTRGLIMGWQYGKDIQQAALAKKDGGPAALKKASALADVVTQVEGDLNPFISTLNSEGYIGDSMEVMLDGNLFAPLKRFVEASIALITEMGAEASSDETGFSDSDKKKLGEKKTSINKKVDLLWQWRNASFVQTIKKAAAGGVRYAGMGSSHLADLEATLPDNSRGYYMDGGALDDFKQKTAALKSLAEGTETEPKQPSKEPSKHK